MAWSRKAAWGLVVLLIACSKSTSDNAQETSAGRDARFSKVSAFRSLGGAEVTGVVKAAAVWSVKSIPVCWESLAAAEAEGRRWTQAAVENSWESNAAIDFTGWQLCRRSEPGVHVWISQDHARTFGLGNELNGKSRPSGGMRLNFTMTGWNSDCRKRFGLKKCIEVVAVHEFGHALGFAHEQNRPETAEVAGEDCAKKARGSVGDKPLTPWDRQSVMNYCNPLYGNGGQLSQDDIKSVREEYGLPIR